MPFSGKKKSTGRANHVYLTGKTSRFENKNGGFSRGGYGINQGQGAGRYNKTGFERGAGSYRRGDVDGNRAYPEQSFNRGYDRQTGYGNEIRGGFGRKNFNKSYGENKFGGFNKNREFNRNEKKQGGFRQQGKKAFNIEKTVTGKIYAGKRTYIFEFQKTENGDRALAVTQTRDDKGRERMDTIMIFHDHIDEFLENVNRVAEMIKKSENDSLGNEKQEEALEDYPESQDDYSEVSEETEDE